MENCNLAGAPLELCRTGPHPQQHALAVLYGAFLCEAVSAWRRCWRFEVEVKAGCDSLAMCYPAFAIIGHSKVARQNHSVLMACTATVST